MPATQEQRNLGIIEIDRGSHAWHRLRVAMNDSTTYKVSINLRGDEVAVKVNGYVWSSGLSTSPRVGIGFCQCGRLCDCNCIQLDHPCEHGSSGC